MTTAERGVEILRILCHRRCEKMLKLAEELEVSVRTIQRDIDKMSLFLPLYTKSGRYGGGVYILGTVTFEQLSTPNILFQIIEGNIEKNK